MTQAIPVYAITGGMSSGKRPLADTLAQQFRSEGYIVAEISELNFTSTDGYVNNAALAATIIGNQFDVDVAPNMVVMHFTDQRSVDHVLEAMRTAGMKHDVHHITIHRVQN